MSSSQGHTAPPAIDPGDERRQRVVDQFRGFPFSSDVVFQQGLDTILTHASTGELPENVRSELVLETKVFYFNRVTGHNINIADVQCTADVNSFSQSGNESQTRGDQQDIRTLSFTELRSLIEQGKTDNIPNNKIIPNILNDGAPSESTAPLRKKPWEDARQS